jgi:uncharacterized protein YciI
VSEPFVRPDAPMCVVMLRYTAPLEAIDAAMGEHVAWLRQAYANDLVLASGRRNPRTGGVVVMRGDAERVEALVATDPFVSGGLAEAEVVAFTASMAAPALAEMLA